MPMSPKHVTGGSGPLKGKMVRKSKDRKIKRVKEVNDEQPSDDDIDFNKRLYPLDHYRDNYSELVDQLFKSVSRGNQLQSLLPDILQDIPTPELKKMCIHQLESMSKKRIGRILAGEDDDCSSSSEEGSFIHHTCAREQKNDGRTEKQVADSTSFEMNDRSTEVLSNSITESNLHQGNVNYEMLELHPDCVDDFLIVDNSNSVPEGISEDFSTKPSEISSGVGGRGRESIEVTVAPTTSHASCSGPKPCMEILELELRARAIKSLLKSQAAPNT